MGSSRIKFIVLGFIFVAFISFSFAEVNGSVKDVINGDILDEDRLEELLSDDTFLDDLNYKIAESEDEDTLTNNKILRKKWLERYGIKGDVEKIELTGGKSYGIAAYFVNKDGDEVKVKLDDLKEKRIVIKKINEDGSVELENGIVFSNGDLNYDSDSNSLSLYAGRVDFSRAELSDEFSIELEVWEMSINGEDFYWMDGSMEYSEDDGFLFSGIVRGNVEGDEEKKFSVYGEDFKIYGSNEEPDKKYSFIQYDKSSGELRASLKHSDEKREYPQSLDVTNDGGISDVVFDEITGEGEIRYLNTMVTVTIDGELQPTLIYDKDGFFVSGFLSSVEEDVRIVNSETGEYKKINNILGEVYNQEQLRQVNEVKLAREMIKQVDSMKDPIAIVISQEDYSNSEATSLPASHDSATRFGEYLVENSGLISENVIPVQDMTSSELKSRLEQIRKDNPDRDFLVYYSGHGQRDRNDEYSLSGTDVEWDRDEGTFSNTLTPEDLNQIFKDKNPLYIVDACHSGGFCSALESNRIRVAAASYNEQGIQIDERVLFSEAVIAPEETFRETTEYGLVPVSNKMIAQGLEDEWLTEIIRRKGMDGTQTPVVFRIVLSILRKLTFVEFLS
jgi:hypothetical protein